MREEEKNWEKRSGSESASKIEDKKKRNAEAFTKKRKASRGVKKKTMTTRVLILFSHYSPLPKPKKLRSSARKLCVRKMSECLAK